MHRPTDPFEQRFAQKPVDVQSWLPGQRLQVAPNLKVDTAIEYKL